MTVPGITLNNGVEIPQLGFGVFQIAPDDTVAAVSTALSVGYRHVDTAQMYGNEREVGEAVRQSGLPRHEVFITSKLSNGRQERDDILRAVDGTVAALGGDPVDLFLIHWPLPTLRDYLVAWHALGEAHAGGKARAIGVSNFQVPHLERVLAESHTVPAVNQIELHPYLVQAELREFGHRHGIATEAWSPIARGKVLDDPTVGAIADRLGRTPAQVVLRWQVQLGNIVFPKSQTPARIAENFSLWDFELGADDMATITALDRGERTGPDPDTFDRVPS